MNLSNITIHPWEPLAGLRSLQREMDRLFGGGFAVPRGMRFPLVNLMSDANEAVVTAEIPGVDPADLEVSLTKGQLTIRGTLKDAAPEGGEVVCHRKERPAGSFARTFPLPFEVEEGKISAKYETGVYQRSFALGRDIDDAAVKARLRDGVLEIELPKAKEARPRRIAVEA